jgi:hypothetical protein
MAGGLRCSGPVGVWQGTAYGHPAAYSAQLALCHHQSGHGFMPRAALDLRRGNGRWNCPPHVAGRLPGSARSNRPISLCHRRDGSTSSGSPGRSWPLQSLGPLRIRRSNGFTVGWRPTTKLTYALVASMPPLRPGATVVAGLRWAGAHSLDFLVLPGALRDSESWTS